MLGAVALQTGRNERAAALLIEAAAQRPDAAAVQANLALALLRLEKFEDAVVCYQRLVALRPTSLEAHIHLATTLSRLGRFAEALRVCDRILETQSGAAEAHLARAVALKDLQRLEASLDACERAVELQPSSAAAWDKRGAALRDLGRFADALRSMQRAVSLDADYALAQEHAGMLLLLQGDFAQGWERYESRLKIGGSVGPRFSERRRWQGQTQGTVLLHAEQGLGDTIQFCRYAPLLAAQGLNVILSVQRSIRRLLTSLAADIRVVADTDPAPVSEWQCPLMSLPQVFGTTPGDVPGAVPYLHAEPARVERWREALAGDEFKIGLCWQGSPGSIDRGRSFPLSLLAPLAALPGIRLISLQKGFGVEQLASLPAGMKIEELGAQCDSSSDAFLDTAAVMDSLDLVITSDTSIAHLAGALGRPAWVALQQVPDWRWLLAGEQTPWYPSLRLFRQAMRGDWLGVFSRMRDELMLLLAARDLKL